MERTCDKRGGSLERNSFEVRERKRIVPYFGEETELLVVPCLKGSDSIVAEAGEYLFIPVHLTR